MTPDADLAVVGAGLMGAATAWAASRRGLDVVLLEQFAPGHDRGSSHGSARIVRRAYADALYVRMTGRAMSLWRELESDAHVSLLRMTGGLDHGAGRDPEGIAAVLADCGVPHDLLSASEAAHRWPGLRFAGPVLHHEEAGTVDAARAVDAFVRRAGERGAQVRHGYEVRRIVVLGEEGVRLEGADGSTVTARRVVVSAGAWVRDLVGGLVPLPELVVTQQQVFHFACGDEVAAEWPVIVHKADLSTYSLPGGRDGGPGDARKIAEHDAGAPTTARTRSGTVDPAARERITAYVRDWLPGLVPEPFNEATCLYTSTLNEDFLLDRAGPVVVASPCSGHGAKFAPLIGEWTTDLATGRGPGPDARFSLAAHG
ncbi:N-methyltryptophan oxidase [Streptomyces spiroverticillatus]|uniref:N-methyltryptophan oxidase n=1 Tax=Streptomyces finlayi TaxID=67296 RepID=A0A918WZE0_9ACTN|nr:FAD-dependent oxidoreductase [Streptomyces finlayi]GHA14237.1 N-methyltryptophan oxidase [Streptomyces spiroverticillatus]GHC97432.1 N-methyltryptophan oxidase [Streptomyces finlayi]